MAQHLGKPAKPIVKPGDNVCRGQRIGEADGMVSSHVHSSVSGKVKQIVDAHTAMGAVSPAIVIENDGQDTWVDDCNNPRSTFSNVTADEIKEAAQWAGLVGMGGAAFPTHVKLNTPPEKPIQAVILNGVECEPYLTCDHRLMIESPQTVVAGMRLLLQATGAEVGIIGIEANKVDAFRLIHRELEAIKTSAECPEYRQIYAKLLPVRYPQGGEKQLIYACVDLTVPSGGLPLDVGVIVQNVATANALYDAVMLRRPLTERIVTVTGKGVERPGNFRVRLGTMVSDLLDACKYDPEKTKRLILGGPMTGASQSDPNLPIVKSTGGILALDDVFSEPYRDCIRCARCIDSCPMQLQPYILSIITEQGRHLESLNYDVLDCIECGVCSYVCPSRRPIVQWIRSCKNELARRRSREIGVVKK